MEKESVEITIPTMEEDRALLKEFYGKSRFPNEPTGADMTYPESEDPEEDEWPDIDTGFAHEDSDHIQSDSMIENPHEHD